MDGGAFATEKKRWLLMGHSFCVTAMGEEHHDAFTRCSFPTCASTHASCRELSSQFYKFAWARAKEKFCFAASHCALGVVIDWLANRNCRWDEMLSVTHPAYPGHSCITFLASFSFSFCVLIFLVFHAYKNLISITSPPCGPWWSLRGCGMVRRKAPA